MSALNNDNPSEANDLCDDLTAKLKRRDKLIKMADRSALGWDTVAEYEADPVASDSDDGKKIRPAEKSALTKYKSKKSNKPKTPKCASFCNNQSALKNKDFVEESNSELLKCGSIIEAENLPEVTNPLSVSIKSSGKKRLILDLRFI